MNIGYSSVFVRCSKLALEKSSTIRQALSGFVSEALDHAPSVVIFDDIDSITSSPADLEGSQPSSSSVELTQFLTNIMDEYAVRYSVLIFKMAKRNKNVPFFLHFLFIFFVTAGMSGTELNFLTTVEQACFRRIKTDCKRCWSFIQLPAE